MLNKWYLKIPCPVESIVTIRMCLKLSMQFVLFMLGSSINSLACLALCTPFQYVIQRFLIHLFFSALITAIEIPVNGSGLIIGLEVLCFASLSVSSFPSIHLCAGTYFIVTLLSLAKLFKTFEQFCTRYDFDKSFLNDFTVASLSVHMSMLLLFVLFSTIL